MTRTAFVASISLVCLVTGKVTSAVSPPQTGRARGGIRLAQATPASPATGFLGSTDRRISLAGEWRFRRDEARVGIARKWYAGPLTAASSGPATIRLPGSTDEAKAGLRNTKKPSLDGLYRPNVYEGPAWYQREVDVPTWWQGRRVSLFLERTHWETRVWLDGVDFGTQDSLIAPHVTDLGAGLSAGRHLLTLRVDNTRKFDLGGFVSVLYEGTQTNWNGLIGKLELRASDNIAIKDVQVYPDVPRKVAVVRVTISNSTGSPARGRLIFTARERRTGANMRAISLEYAASEPINEVTAELPIEDMRLWDEFSPALYDLTVYLAANGNPSTDEHKVTFGMRRFGIRGTQFTMNDRPLFLRGTLECGIFPHTGYPPTDVESWRRIFRIIKSYGLNFMRFHSWCPPDAAFTAADTEGVMLQVEGPMANISVGTKDGRDEFLEQEFLRIIRTYGNHPSFCLMTLGNEFGGDEKLVTRWVDMLRAEDSRHLYSSSSAGMETANRQFTEGMPRGIHGPGTDSDFRDAIARLDRPLIGHEIGQWTFYPNFDEMRKYTGVLEARNFGLVRDSLRARGMLDLAPKFAQATGKQAVLLYKEEIEVLMRTAGHAGFSLLDLHDYPGQGTALIGLLDPFWDSKGFITPAAHKRYCGPTVPLLRMAKRTWTAGEAFVASAEIAHFGPTDLTGAQPRWSIRNSQGVAIAAGSLPVLDVPTGKVTALGAIRASLAKVPVPCKLTVSVSLKGTAFSNNWDIWAYPARETPKPPANVLVSRTWDVATKAALARGRSVFLLPRRLGRAQTLPGGFLPVFWSPVWFPSQKPNTMGILCDPLHPAFARFPTEAYSNWQWWDLIQNSRTLNLSATPASFRPIVQVIDNFARNDKLGDLFEARVGKGRLLVSTMNLVDDQDKRPAARQLLRSLYAYAGSNRFRPKQALPISMLDKLFEAPSVLSTLAKLRARVVDVDSEDTANGNVASRAIDGDPDTIWHTKWSPTPDPMPHHVTIDLGRIMMLKGVTYLPRQDMANGRVAHCDIYCSLDPASWAAPVARAEWANTDQLQTVHFRKPVKARYVKLVATSEVSGNAFAAIAELDVIPSAR